MLRLFTIFLCFVLQASAELLAESPKPSLIVFKDDEVYRALPKKFLFPDVENALFRSNDGKKLYLGPGRDGAYFVLTSDDKVQVLTAPGQGKAYLDSGGEFAIWYDTLQDGIHFKSGEMLKLDDPFQTRLGVCYDATHFYLSKATQTRVFESSNINEPLLSLSGFYSYKLTAHENELHLVGYSYLGHEEVRTHEYKRFMRVEGKFILMNTIELPDHLVLLDHNPFNRQALFLNDAQMVPQLFMMNLADESLKSLGMVQFYGFFLHPDFRNIMPTTILPKN